LTDCPRLRILEVSLGGVVLAAVMWSSFAIAVVAVVAFVVSLTVIQLRPRTKPQGPALWLVPLSGCAFVSAFVGGFCGLVLATVSDEGSLTQVVLTAVAIILLAGGVLATAELLRQMWLSRRRDRLSEQVRDKIGPIHYHDGRRSE
jgi:hypothetical protein